MARPKASAPPQSTITQEPAKRITGPLGNLSEQAAIMVALLITFAALLAVGFGLHELFLLMG